MAQPQAQVFGFHRACKAASLKMYLNPMDTLLFGFLICPRRRSRWPFGVKAITFLLPRFLSVLLCKVKLPGYFCAVAVRQSVAKPFAVSFFLYIFAEVTLLLCFVLNYNAKIQNKSEYANDIGRIILYLTLLQSRGCK